MPKCDFNKVAMENYQWKITFLIDLLTFSEIFSNWMFFSFVSLIINRGFFLACLENMVYDYVLWRHDDFQDDVGVFFLILILGITAQEWGLRAEGRGLWA